MLDMREDWCPRQLAKFRLEIPSLMLLHTPPLLGSIDRNTCSAEVVLPGMISLLKLVRYLERFVLLIAFVGYLMEWICFVLNTLFRTIAKKSTWSALVSCSLVGRSPPLVQLNSSSTATSTGKRNRRRNWIVAKTLGL